MLNWLFKSAIAFVSVSVVKFEETVTYPTLSLVLAMLVIVKVPLFTGFVAPVIYIVSPATRPKSLETSSVSKPIPLFTKDSGLT